MYPVREAYQTNNNVWLLVRLIQTNNNVWSLVIKQIIMYGYWLSNK